MPLLPPLHGARPTHEAPERPRPAPPAERRWLVDVGLLVAAIVFVLDQATKQVAEALLVRGRMVEVVGDSVGWQLVYNDGGAFGFPAPSWFFLIVTVVVAVIVVRNLPRVEAVSHAVAYGLLLAGAVGNAADRVFRPGGPQDPRYLHGHVIDFVAWGSWPRFNVADVAIVSGFLLLLLLLTLEEREVR